MSVLLEPFFISLSRLDTVSIKAYTNQISSQYLYQPIYVE